MSFCLIASWDPRLTEALDRVRKMFAVLDGNFSPSGRWGRVDQFVCGVRLMSSISEMSVFMKRVAGWQRGDRIGPAIAAAADALGWTERQVRSFWYKEYLSVDTDKYKFAQATADEAEAARAVAKAEAAAAVLDEQASEWLALDPVRYRDRCNRMRDLARQLRNQHPSTALERTNHKKQHVLSSTGLRAGGGGSDWRAAGQLNPCKDCP